MRSILKREDPDRYILNPGDFPIHMDGILYVRQSTEYQREHNVHSLEMQTSRFEEHFRNRGCTGHIAIIPEDEEGKTSGTLPIHKRPGLSRVLRRIEEEGGKSLGWVAAVAVNRFTRDPWGVTPGTLMQACFEHNVWISTLRMDFNFKDDYCRRVFMLEAEEAARHLEWMKVVLGGAKRTASSNGYYDARPVPPGYIVDRSDPKRKKLVLYEPWGEPTRWLFRRHFELGFNFTRLCREVDALDYLYPPFESWVDPKTVAKIAIKQITEGPFARYYKPTRSGLHSILTNPVYIGWWLPLGGGYIPNNHPRLIPEEDEALFWLNHKRLSSFDLEGNRQRPEMKTRYGQCEGLLKKVLETPEGHPFYAIRDGRKDVYKSSSYNGLAGDHILSLIVSFLDNLFLEKFFEHLRAWQGFDDWEDKIEQLDKLREARIATIQRQIATAKAQWQEAMATLKDPTIPKTAQMKIDLAKTCAGLEQTIAALEKDAQESVTEDEEDELTQYQIYTLLPDLIDNWTALKFDTRLQFVNALTRKVVVHCPSPAFVQMDIHWKRPTWLIDRCVVRRLIGNGKDWTEEEDRQLREVYGPSSHQTLLTLFPDRTWSSIKHRGIRLRLKRNYPPRYGVEYFDLSMQDLAFCREQGIDPTDKNPHWYQ